MGNNKDGHFDGDMVVRGELNNKDVNILLDSGSSVSIIGGRAMELIGDESNIEPPEFQSIVAVNSSRTEVTGMIRGVIKIGDFQSPVKLNILPGANHEILLGRDWISTNVQAFNFDTGEIVFKGNKDTGINTANAQEGLSTITRAKVAKLTVLEPSEEAEVEVYPGSDMVAKELLFTPDEKTQSCGLSAKNQIVPGFKSTMKIRVINGSNKKIRLFPNRCIGSFKIQGSAQVNVIVIESNEENRLTHNVQEHDGLEDEVNQLKDFLHDRRNVFASKMSEMGRAKSIKHEIRLETEKPIRARFYRLDRAKEEILEQKVQEMWDNDLIEPSKSEFSSPSLIVEKATGGHRVVTDFRQLNQVTIHDSMPMPLIQDILDGLGKAKFFSTIDLYAGYHQIEMEEESKKYTAFVTKNKLMQYKVMAMGLRNSGATFQRLMNQIFQGLNYKILYSYIDDVIIFSETVPEHIERLRLAFDRLEAENLRLKFDKCKFLQTSVDFLGYKLSGEGVQPNPKKLAVVRDYPIPRSVKEVRSFTGLCSYFRRSVKDFSKIASPLYNLTKKDVKFVWDDKCAEAFHTLKNGLIKAPVLKFPDFDKEFILHSDGCLTGIGFFLTQVDENNIPHPIGFGGRSLNKHEQNYAAHEIELLALLSGIRYFRQYLALKPFTAYCDSQSIVWLLKQKETRGRLARWLIEFNNYECRVIHKAGKHNEVADALSRSTNLPTSCSTQHTSDHERIRCAQREDRELQPILNFFDNGTVPEGYSAMKMSQNFIIDSQNILYFVKKSTR